MEGPLNSEGIMEGGNLKVVHGIGQSFLSDFEACGMVGGGERIQVIPPDNFAVVEEGLYRSGCPTALHFPFLEQLHLRSILYLSPNEIPDLLQNWSLLHDINIFSLSSDDTPDPKDPYNTLSMASVREGVNTILDGEVSYIQICLAHSLSLTHCRTNPC